MKRFLSVGAVVLVVVAAVSIGYSWGISKLTSTLDELKPFRQQNNKYAFINPLLAYDVPESTKEFSQYRPLTDKVTTLISAQVSSGKAESISVYFRDLAKGRWVGINQNATFAPASMLKVVIMIAYYKEAESNPALLQRKFRYSKSLAKEIGDIPFQTSSELKVGTSYTVEDLIEAMIIKSDNGAKDVLLAHIEEKNLDEVYTDLGLANPDAAGADYTISAKSYSLFLRILYNATYLNRAMSEQALTTMSRAEYHDGLAAGIAADVPIAQKFGEHVYTDTAGQPMKYDLSDCGIIYHPQRPYILCVMSRGTSIDALGETIRGISGLVYKEVESNYQD